MTLNQLAEDGAYKLGDQYNDTLRESIKHTLIYYRAKYIRDDVTRNGVPSLDLYESVIMEMEEVNKLVDVGVNLNTITSNGTCYTVIDGVKYSILKSKKQLPKTVRLKSYGKMPYRFVGSVDRLVRFLYSEPIDIEFKSVIPYQKRHPIYFFIANNYLYLLNTLKVRNVLIDGIFSNPREVHACNGEGFADDKEFPIPEDMLVSIMDNIVNKTYPLRGADGQTINLQKDDKDKDSV